MTPRLELGSNQLVDGLQKLEQMLRPAAGGIYTVSTGTKEQLKIQEKIYGSGTAEEIRERWLESLGRLADAQLVILGVPSDVGAGFLRGANFGPQSIRRELLRRKSWLYDDRRVVDVGDVLVVPQLLHDSMLSESQRRATHEAMYPGSSEDLPVSPLSIAEEALKIVRQASPKAAPLVLGGDHSVGWPALAAVAAGREQKVGILHFDAHTDLLEHRLGVRYCFATWAFHANELIGRKQKLNQVGIRISGKTKQHWENTCGVRQFWMDEVLERSTKSIGDEIIDNLKSANVEGLYISNDIDGTDPLFGLSTGTPEPGGLHPDMVVRLIKRISKAFPVWGSDLVEVAPTVAGHSPREPASTLATAAHYVEVQAEVTLGGR